jgi:3-isopropylmalate/(R)-2-methylmalate dehydratase small subunit
MAKAVLALGDDVSTDAIYPGRYMATVLPTETPAFAFADLADFNARLRAGEFPPGSVVVAGRNFGCGSSREQAASCLQGHGLVVVAKGFARIFLLNAINVGLPVFLVPEMEAVEGDELEVSATDVLNRTSGRAFVVRPLPAARQAILDAGGLVEYTRRRLRQGAGPALPGAPGC